MFRIDLDVMTLGHFSWVRGSVRCFFYFMNESIDLELLGFPFSRRSTPLLLSLLIGRRPSSRSGAYIPFPSRLWSYPSPPHPTLLPVWCLGQLAEMLVPRNSIPQATTLLHVATNYPYLQLHICHLPSPARPTRASHSPYQTCNLGHHYRPTLAMRQHVDRSLVRDAMTRSPAVRV
ncbi:hypothetical protein CPB85DRAFT_250967 [Mucidula mucida]|nr:hypothetical protein CPB85DRAFT_250967 [Mucidula mucida]